MLYYGRKSIGVKFMNNDSYNWLLKIVDENMQQSGKTFENQKAAFFYYLDNNPYKVDVMKLLEMDVSDEEFFNIAHIAFFDRLADEDTLLKYKNSFSCQSEEFRRKVICDFRNSEEMKISSKKIINYTDPKRDVDSDIINVSMKQSAMIRILPLYKKLPNGMKKCVRKIFGVGE